MGTKSSEAGAPAIAKAAQAEEGGPAIDGEVELPAEERPSTGASPIMTVEARKSSSTVDITDGKSVSGPVSDGEMPSVPITDGQMASGPDSNGGGQLGSGGAKAAPKMERKSSIARFIKDLESGSRPVVDGGGGEVASAPADTDGQSSGSGAPKPRPRMEKKPSIAKLVKDLESGSGPVTSDHGQLLPPSSAAAAAEVADDDGPSGTEGPSGAAAKARPKMERKSSIAKFIKDLEDKAKSDQAPQAHPTEPAAIAKADRARAVESAMFKNGPRAVGLAPARRFRSHLKELMDAFQVFDADRSGMISADELALLFKSIGIQLTEEETNSMINEVDSNGSGTLEFIEFVRMMERSVNGETSIQKKLYEAFKFFDRSGDGRISPQELQEALQKLRGELIPIREVKIMMGKADVDGDGHISFKEFLTFLATASFDQ